VTLNNSLTRLDPSRVNKVNERKQSLDQLREQRLHDKVQRGLNTAEEKRAKALEQKKNKLK
jgi:hypothetical protein